MGILQTVRNAVDHVVICVLKRTSSRTQSLANIVLFNWHYLKFKMSDPSLLVIIFCIFSLSTNICIHSLDLFICFLISPFFVLYID